jgi:hypothetical protein
LREGELEVVARLAAIYVVYPGLRVEELREWLGDVESGARRLSEVSVYSLATARVVLMELKESWKNAETLDVNELL